MSTVQEAIRNNIISNIFSELVCEPEHYTFASTYILGRSIRNDTIYEHTVPKTYRNALVNIANPYMHTRSLIIPINIGLRDDNLYQTAYEIINGEPISTPSNKALSLSMAIAGALEYIGIDGAGKSIFTSPNPATLQYKQLSSPRKIRPNQLSAPGDTGATLVEAAGIYIVLLKKPVMTRVLDYIKNRIGHGKHADVYDSLAKHLQMSTSDNYYAVPIGGVARIYPPLPVAKTVDQPITPGAVLGEHGLDTDKTIPATVMKAYGYNGIYAAVDFLKKGLREITASAPPGTYMVEYFDLNSMYTAYILSLKKIYRKILDKHEKRYMDGLATLAYLYPSNPVFQARMITYTAILRAGDNPEKHGIPPPMISSGKYSLVTSGKHAIIYGANKPIIGINLEKVEHPAPLAYLLSNIDCAILSILNTVLKTTRYVWSPTINVQRDNVMNSLRDTVTLFFKKRNMLIPPNNPANHVIMTELIRRYGDPVELAAEYLPPWYKLKRFNVELKSVDIYVVEWMTWNGSKKLIIRKNKSSSVFEIITGLRRTSKLMLTVGFNPSLLPGLLVPDTYAALRRDAPWVLDAATVFLDVFDPSVFTHGAYSFNYSFEKAEIEACLPGHPFYRTTVTVNNMAASTRPEYYKPVVLVTPCGKKVEIMPGDVVQPTKYGGYAVIRHKERVERVFPLMLFRPTVKLRYAGVDAYGGTVFLHMGKTVAIN